MNKFIGVELEDDQLYDVLITPLYETKLYSFYLELQKQEVITEHSKVIIDNVFNVGNTYNRFVEIHKTGRITPVLIRADQELRMIANDLLIRNLNIAELKRLSPIEKALLLKGISI